MIFHEKILYVINNKSKSSNETDIFFVSVGNGNVRLNVCALTKKPARKTTVSVPKDSKEYQIEKDGFEWYKVCKNGKFGVENRNGTLLIPLEYDYIRHIGGL